jgi:DNA-binding transcriptional regulator YdaS (Cro superfamily)
VTPAELKEIGERLYGYGWQTRLAERLGVDGSTVRRWVSGKSPIPGPAAAAIRCFLTFDNPAP